MSLMEPRCLVCGNPLNSGAPFEDDVRNSEVCSDKCYAIYTHNPDSETAFEEGKKAFCDGASIEENPYYAGENNADKWIDGFVTACLEKNNVE